MYSNHKIDESNLDTYIPIRLPIRIRKDNDGFVILINWIENRWMCASESVLDILDLCDGILNSGKIVEQYSQKYPDADFLVIKNDVYNILKKAEFAKFILLKEPI